MPVVIGLRSTIGRRGVSSWSRDYVHEWGCRVSPFPSGSQIGGHLAGKASSCHVLAFTSVSRHTILPGFHDSHTFAPRFQAPSNSLISFLCSGIPSSLQSAYSFGKSLPRLQQEDKNGDRGRDRKSGAQKGRNCRMDRTNRLLTGFPFVLHLTSSS